MRAHDGAIDGKTLRRSFQEAGQKQISADIHEAGADCLLAVKDNQPTLNAEVITVFERRRREPALLHPFVQEHLCPISAAGRPQALGNRERIALGA
jgi:hypothetical protein